MSGAVGDTECGRRVIVHAVRDRREIRGGGEDLVGKSAVEARAGDAVPDRAALATGTQCDYLPGELTTGNERRRYGDLVLAADQQDIREIHGRGAHPYSCLPLSGHGYGPLLDSQDVRCPVLRTDNRTDGYFPCHTGSRFSMNAIAPSLASALANTTPCQCRNRSAALPGSVTDNRTSSLHAATPNGPLAAIRSANAIAVSSTWSAGVTALNRPIS